MVELSEMIKIYITLKQEYDTVNKEREKIVYKSNRLWKDRKGLSIIILDKMGLKYKDNENTIERVEELLPFLNSICFLPD